MNLNEWMDLIFKLVVLGLVVVGVGACLFLAMLLVASLPPPGV